MEKQIKIENKVWKVHMKNEDDYQYVFVTRKADGKQVMCFSSGDVGTEIRPIRPIKEERA